jgi:hypothetical protein
MPTKDLSFRERSVELKNLGNLLLLELELPGEFLQLESRGFSESVL